MLKSMQANKVTTLLLLFFFSATNIKASLSATKSKRQVYVQPEQVHLSYGAHPSQMMVTWVTMHDTNGSLVEYGIDELSQTAEGKTTLFTDGGFERRQLFIHRVLITNLKPNQQYSYHCGSSYGWSPTFWFRTMQEGTKWSPRFAVYGDLGNENAISLPRLQKETYQKTYDLILHVGDFAYDMRSNQARVGDEFMRQIEPIAAYIPYMTCVGNHENAYNFSNYNNRFSMIGMDGNINNHFYSFNIGPAHLIGFSTEFYFYILYGMEQIKHQYEWLEQDLKQANHPENRTKRPWIITFGHRPMYCSNANNDDCTNHQSIVRTGRPENPSYGLEDLFYRYGVDLELWAHEHSYERLWPVYNQTVFNGSDEEPYTNPKAPVHIITGSPGNQEKLDPFGSQKPWSAYRTSDYGYTRMTIVNDSHLHIEQLSETQDGKIVDSVTIIKNVHGPEAWI